MHPCTWWLMIFCWLSAPKMMQNMSCPLCFLRMRASQEPGESADSRQRLHWPTSWAPMVPFIDNPWIFGQHPLSKYILHICKNTYDRVLVFNSLYITYIWCTSRLMKKPIYIYVYIYIHQNVNDNVKQETDCTHRRFSTFPPWAIVLLSQAPCSACARAPPRLGKEIPPGICSWYRLRAVYSLIRSMRIYRVYLCLRYNHGIGWNMCWRIWKRYRHPCLVNPRPSLLH